MTTITAPDTSRPMERLLTELSQQGVRHLGEAETDLGQTGTLLDEAITKLTAAFMELHAAVQVQQEQVNALLQQQASVDVAQQVSLQQLSEVISGHVNEAITGLQFQDLTGQLIARTSMRLAGLRDMLEQAGGAVEGLQKEVPAADAPATLNAVADAVAARSSALEEVLRKSVLQHHMDSGDIELF